MTAPFRAVSASLADMTRWKTSCCGMDPIIIVIADATNNNQFLIVGSGRIENKSRSLANANTLLAPPACSADIHAM